jgi:hypothetical protein
MSSVAFCRRLGWLHGSLVHLSIVAEILFRPQGFHGLD